MSAFKTFLLGYPFFHEPHQYKICGQTSKFHPDLISLCHCVTLWMMFFCHFCYCRASEKPQVVANNMSCWLIRTTPTILWGVEQPATHFMLTCFYHTFWINRRIRKKQLACAENAIGLEGGVHSILLNFQSQHWLFLCLALNPAPLIGAWTSSFLSSAPDNVAVTVYGLVSTKRFIMIDSLTGPVIGCLVCSVTK